ncbi:phage major capsid protein [Megamonas sp.]|uniref:phage major capsid protein n=1 Tax=Megamonas sp. TaxID=2049033 RepID=UPI00259016AD|nr:phage major capsid protein [Megamonas sp.]
MNLKQMIEERNEKLARAKEILPEGTEVRSLDEDQAEELRSLKSDIEALDANIEKEKETRSQEREEIGGANNMDHEKDQAIEVEVRAVDKYLRDNTDVELRSLSDAVTVGNVTENTAGNGGITVPLNVHNEIIRELTEASPVFAAARKFGSVTGQLKVAREVGVDDTGFIGEAVDASKIKPTLKSVTLNQKRVGAAIQLTNQLLNDSGVDLVGYSTDRLSRSLARTIERAILVGAKSGETASDVFRPIIGDSEVAHISLVGETPTVDELIDIYGSLNPGYLNGAMFIVSRKVFNAMLKLKDGDGSFLILRDQVNGQPGYRLFGVPVYVSDFLTGQEKQIVFGNINQAYGMLVKQGINLINVTADTTQALAGGRLVIMDTYLDGAVINPKAVVTAGKNE